MDGRNRIIGLFTRGRRARRSLLSFIHQFDGQHYYFVNLNAICVHLDKDALGQAFMLTADKLSAISNNAADQLCTYAQLPNGTNITIKL